MAKHAGQSFADTENLTLGKYDLYVIHLSDDLSKDDDVPQGDKVVNAEDEKGGEIDKTDIDLSALAQKINQGALGKNSKG